MAQIYSRTANFVMRVAIAAGIVGLVGVCFWWYYFHESDMKTRKGFFLEQPVPFSHIHHVSYLAIDCRYCHQTVESEAFAGLPPTDLCMNCHLQIWTRADLLRPVRESWRTGRRLQWNRVNQLADYVFFNHSVHVTNGIGCYDCHGRVDLMPLTAKGTPLYMKQCLACHRQPEKFLRPRDAITNLAWRPPPDQQRRGAELMKEYRIDKTRLTDCWTCHR